MKKLFVIAVLFAVMAGSIYAQGMGVTGWSSPQSTATQGRIRSAADDFIRPDSYTSAGINDWFAMTSFASTSSVSLGYAKKLENLYIAAYYGGTFWANITPFDYTEKEDPTWPGGKKTVQVYDSLSFTTPTPSNRVAVLIGVADMGFRFTYYTTHESFDKKDISDGTNQYSSYKQDTGIIRPQLAWSMTKNLAENGIKPYVTVDLEFNRDYLKAESATGSAGESIGRSYNIVQPIIQVGLGGYNLHSKDAFRLSADLEYRLTLNIYDNEYSYLDGTKNKTGKISGLNNSGTYTENSDITNLITPYLAAQWGGGPVALRARLQLPVSLRNRETAPVTANKDKLEKNGQVTSTATFGFNPSIQLAMQWRPISKLALNVGGLIGMGNISSVTTESSTYSNDKEQDNSSQKRVTSTIGPTSNQLTVGVTFNPTDYLAFEANTGLFYTDSTTGKTTNNVNVFETGTTGLFNFGSILVSLKF